MSVKKWRIGLVGATGMVGQTFVKILQEKQFPVQELRPFASEKSLGQKITLQGQSFPIEVLRAGCFADLDLVFFSSGDEISREWAPQAVQAGAFAVDNSAAFRMDGDKILCVPEVNGDLLAEIQKHPQIIANPNCTTIQLVVALSPLQKKFGLREVRVASYQAVSGAGIEAYNELLTQTQAGPPSSSHPKLDPSAQVFPHPIAYNCIPQIGSFLANGFTGEEMKVMKETRKILRQQDLKVSAFTVRVPVLNAHAEAVWVTLDKKVSEQDVHQALREATGLIVQDDPKSSVYPQQYQASGTDPVYVGRVHRDLEDEHTWLMWIVADNIRKGAALNGIQIAERIFAKA